MKKLLLSVLCMCFFIPSQAFSGVYVAPKFAVNFVSTPEGFINIEISGIVATESSNAKIDDTLFSGSLAIGYDFNSTYNVPIRAELEYSFFSQFDSKIITFWGNLNAEMNMQTVFINAYYDFHNTSKLTPYVGLGLGFAFIDLNATVAPYSSGKHTQTSFAWNVGVGSSYAFTDNISLDLAYRYAQLGKAETKKIVISATQDIWGSTDTISAHQIMLGIRYSF